jgi:hypothetical protein
MANLARLNHERHFDTNRFSQDELIVPAGLVLGMTTSIASKDLHEVIHEEVSECVFPNRLSPGTMVTSIFFD